MGQSPLLDPHRHQEAGWDGGKVDDRRRYPEHTAPTRPEKAGPAAWHGDQDRGLSGQGRRTPGKRPEFDAPQRARPVPRVVGHRRSAGWSRSDGRWRSSQVRAFAHDQHGNLNSYEQSVRHFAAASVAFAAGARDGAAPIRANRESANTGESNQSRTYSCPRGTSTPRPRQADAP